MRATFPRRLRETRSLNGMHSVFLDAGLGVSPQAQSCESLRARIGIAQALAISNYLLQAHDALAEVLPLIERSDNETMALCLQAQAITAVEARALDDGLNTFQLALESARTHGDPVLCSKILNNYGTAEARVGKIDLAIAHIEEALQIATETAGATNQLILANLAEAVFASGNLRRAAALIHEYHAIHSGSSRDVLGAAAVGISVGMMLPDDGLLLMSRNPDLLVLGFARREPWLFGPIIESFCALYEHEDRRAEHDALLFRALDTLTSFDDNCLGLGIRAARLGTAHYLPRISALMSRQCDGPSELLRAHRDLFDSHVLRRRRLNRRATELGLRAANGFARSGRPIMQADALEAAGFARQAQAVRGKCGARNFSRRLNWTKAHHRRVAADLTPREFEIAQLAAQGASNRAIAMSLKISERTVHKHLELTFGKLGVRSRWQLLQDRHFI
jgi:DNA-binding CsgD family transcriptional regulator/tetratricopeptide (TPR) repeat protein